MDHFDINEFEDRDTVSLEAHMKNGHYEKRRERQKTDDWLKSKKGLRVKLRDRLTAILRGKRPK